ncbi:hypothetical protein [uncultured Bacteroides sp.]|uniref:hypothetical protein n=1 Tax=uncultured Bacteroides sp. TaxID=162156 RepID=UPI00262DC33B|nr:hypothetical protein [uncultured Bacteroides sp.]
MEKKSISECKKNKVKEENKYSNEHDDEVLELDELFGVQGGVNSDDNKHLEETCGLGCLQGHVIIRKENGTK